MNLPELTPEKLEEITVIECGLLMLKDSALRKEIWDSKSREKAKKWTNWIGADPYRYDDLKAVKASFREQDYQPIISFGASRFPEGRAGMFEMRPNHVVSFMLAPSGDLIKLGDTFDDCPDVFSTTEFIAIAPDSLSCWSNQTQYRSDSLVETSESSREFAKAFLAHRRQAAIARPELDEETHLREAWEFRLFSKRLSHTGEKSMAFGGTIAAYVYG